MIRISDYIAPVFNAVKGVVGNVYLDRPMSVSGKVCEYAVVTTPSNITNKEIDTSGGYDYYVSTIDIYIFVKDKLTSQNTNQRDIKRIDFLTKGVLELFPIRDKERNVMAYRPQYILSASDGSDWHYALITVRLTTLIS